MWASKRPRAARRSDLLTNLVLLLTTYYVPSEDLAPLVGLPVGGRDRIYHDLLSSGRVER